MVSGEVRWGGQNKERKKVGTDLQRGASGADALERSLLAVRIILHLLSLLSCLCSPPLDLLLHLPLFVLKERKKKDTSQRSARLSRVSRLAPCLWWSYQTFGALLSVNFSLMCRAAPLTLTAKLPQSHFAWLGGKRGITKAKWQSSHYFQNKVWIVVHLMDWWYVTKDSYTNWYLSDKYANYRTPGNNVSTWQSTNYCRKKKKKAQQKTVKVFFSCAAQQWIVQPNCRPHSINTISAVWINPKWHATVRAAAIRQ